MTPPLPTDIPRVPDHELLRLIGRGSYGEVWLARNIMGVWRAVKVVTRASFDSDRPFEREFAGIQRFEPISRTGEGLVPILHVGSYREKESFYYVMELADAQAGVTEFDAATYAPRTLRSDLKRMGRLPIEECVEIGLMLAAGLNSMHKHGLVHRDIKPSNIVFTQGRAKLADMGLVGEIRKSQTFVGTEGYIPPEGPGTTGADFFALGKVLYEAATGLSPDEFPNPPADWLTGEVPHGALDLHEVILRACESDPARRYQNAAQMQADLALMQSGQSVRRARRLEKRVRTLRRIGIAAALTATLATGLGLFATYRARIEVENVRSANELRGRAENAEKAARAQLAEAQLARAGMERRTGRAGQRGRALEWLREAAPFHTNRVELRSETVAALALADIREVERGRPGSIEPTRGSEVLLPARARDFVAGPYGGWCVLDETLRRYTKAHADGSVRIYAWEDDQEIVTLEGSRAELSQLTDFSSGGDRIAGQVRSEAVVWDATSGRRIFSTNILSRTGVDMTPDGEWVALREAESNLIQFYRGADGSPGPVVDVGFKDGDFWISPDNRELIAYGSGSCEVRRFEIASGQALASVSLPALVCAWKAFWAPDSRGLLVVGNDFCGYYVRLDAPQTKPIRLQGHSAEMVVAGFHPTRPFVLTASWDGTARLWDLRNGRSLALMPRAGFGLRWTADNRIGWVEYAGAGRYRLAEFQMFEPEGVRLMTEPMPRDWISGHKGPWHGTFVAEGAAFAAATYDGVRVWASAGDGDSVLVNLGPTRWLQLAGDGRRLWSSARQGLYALRLNWRENERALTIQMGEPQRDFGGGEWALATRDGKPGVVAAHGNYYVEATTEGYKQIGSFPRFTKFMAASPDGRWTLSGIHSETDLTLWRTEPWGEARKIHSRLSPQAVFTPDSKSFIITSTEEVRRERVDDGAVEWRFRPAGSIAPGISIALSADASMVAITIGTSEAALLDARTGQLLLQLRPLENGLISDLAFSGDGRRLAVLTQNHFGHLWDLGLLRSRLRTLGLDWDPPAPTHPEPRSIPISIRVEPAK